MPWLDLLDELLRAGAAGLGRPFVAAQVAWLEARQASGGGFPGRSGPPDPYYTDFALRALDLIAPDSPTFAAAASFVLDQPPPTDVIGAFSILSCERILTQRGIAPALDHEAVRAVVEAQALPGGGFAAVPGSGELSAYRTFLGTLCLEMLGSEAVPAAEALRLLRRDSGGFAERPGEDRAQTSATAAVIAVLALEGALAEDEAAGAARFLATMQGVDGGLRAHADAPEGDLLSTFTGLLTMGAADAVESLDLPALGRFVRAVARPGGGFGATPSDPGADVEYAYYGLAMVSLLRAATVAPGAALRPYAPR